MNQMDSLFLTRIRSSRALFQGNISLCQSSRGLSQVYSLNLTLVIENMAFWGVEIKPNQSVKCAPRAGRFLHISQAALGESTGKAKGNIPIFVKTDRQKLVLGNLSLEKCPQIDFDLFFEKEFELSHASKTCSVYFCGYHDGNGESGYSDSESEEEDVPTHQNADGKTVGNAVNEDKSTTKGRKPDPVKVDKVKAAIVDSDSGSEDDTDDDSEDSPDSDKAVLGKRPAESPAKTPVPGKKAKVVTPVGQKSGADGKKGVVHVATPYPHKKQAKTLAANSDKSKQETPKSAGSVSCSSCNRKFNSEIGLQAHTKAKHG